MYVDSMLYAAEELANAVIIQAAIDYRQAMKDLWLCPRDAKAKYMLEDCENFFKSRYFNFYTSIDGVWLMNKLKEEFETKTRKELEKCISPMIKNCRDLVETFLLDHPYIPFAHRVIDMLAKYKGNKLFYNNAHKAAFEAAMSEINDDDYDHIACVYVLTIRPDIWEHCVHTSQGYLCMSAEIEQKDRVLVSFANEIYRSTTKLSLKEISFRRNVSDKEFYYVCNAILIRRFGLAVIKKGA